MTVGVEAEQGAPDEGPPAAPARPWIRPRQMVLRTAFVVALVALDLWSKQATFAWLDGRPPAMAFDEHGHLRYPLLGNWLAFMKSLNPGAAFGQLGQFPHALVIGRCVAVVVLTWLLLRTAPRPRLVVWALTLILAGAAGNLFDNLVLEHDGHPFGKVRDFIDVYFAVWDWHFPTFNVADSCITTGAALLFLSCLVPAGQGGGERSTAGPASAPE